MSQFNDKPADEKTFLTQIGSKATIQRETMRGDKASIPNKNLCDLGLSLDPFPDNPGLVDYKGSAAVHIYYNETLKQIFFISQTQPLELYRCPQPLAAKAFDDLVGTMKLMYGHRRGRLRSGF